MRDEIEVVLEAAPGPVSTPDIARRIGQDADAVRETLGSMYTHHEVERARHANGHTWLWSMRPEDPLPLLLPVTRSDLRIQVEAERLPYNEQVRVATRVRRMLAAHRGEPEPMSGAPRGR